MKNYITILLILAIITCLKLRSTANYKYALSEDRNLYIEVYRSGLTGNVTSAYLTDSTNFRVFLGMYNSKKASLRCKLSGDRIIVEKKLNDANTPEVIERKIYNLKDLIGRRNYN
jgi:hypothetical protein